jgi:hypothetical protein
MTITKAALLAAADRAEEWTPEWGSVVKNYYRAGSSRGDYSTFNEYRLRCGCPTLVACAVDERCAAEWPLSEAFPDFRTAIDAGRGADVAAAFRKAAETAQ